VVLAGGTAFPGCAGLTCYFGTGWKACATDLKELFRPEQLMKTVFEGRAEKSSCQFLVFSSQRF
jgi:hypothetical protein